MQVVQSSNPIYCTLSDLMVIYIRHDMKTLSALLALCDGNPSFRRSLIDFPHKVSKTERSCCCYILLTHLGLESHICVMKNSPHFPSDAYMRRKSLYFSYRSRGRPTKQCQAKMSFNRVAGMMTSSNQNIFCVTGPLWGESTGDQWIPVTIDSNAEL